MKQACRDDSERRKVLEKVEYTGHLISSYRHRIEAQPGSIRITSRSYQFLIILDNPTNSIYRVNARQSNKTVHVHRGTLQALLTHPKQIQGQYTRYVAGVVCVYTVRRSRRCRLDSTSPVLGSRQS